MLVRGREGWAATDLGADGERQTTEETGPAAGQLATHLCTEWAYLQSGGRAGLNEQGADGGLLMRSWSHWSSPL